ncbi:MAG: DUF4347 domain-containing protein [Leptolyngbya sp. SIO1D8]|nr:DUF4347 domain-containing protein [Leptolyngbya sp. SIO1D8]
MFQDLFELQRVCPYFDGLVQGTAGIASLFSNSIYQRFSTVKYPRSHGCDRPLRDRLVFIDLSIDDSTSLINGVLPDSEVFLLDPSECGITQMTAVLAGRTHIASVHIISHGRPGTVQLGNTQVNIDTLDHNQAALRSWRRALRSDAEVLFYGCNVAGGGSGRSGAGRDPGRPPRLWSASLRTNRHHPGLGSLRAGGWALGL